jgi:hypothetical protein
VYEVEDYECDNELTAGCCLTGNVLSTTQQPKIEASEVFIEKTAVSTPIAAELGVICNFATPLTGSSDC